MAMASVLRTCMYAFMITIFVVVLLCVFVSVWSVKPHGRTSERLSHMEVLYITMVFSFVLLLSVQPLVGLPDRAGSTVLPELSNCVQKCIY